MAIKRELFGELDGLVDPEAILATNTSTLSITSIAAATDRPEQVVGIHFMNPVTIMEGIEIVVGITGQVAGHLPERRTRPGHQGDER